MSADDVLRIDVAGPPVPCARARVVRAKGSRKVHAFTPTKTAAFEEHVRWAARAAAAAAHWRFSDCDRFSIEIDVHCATDRGDWDNYGKALTDPLKGIAWKDDQHVKHAVVRVLVDRERPRSSILIRKIPWRAPAPVSRNSRPEVRTKQVESVADGRAAHQPPQNG